MTQNQPKYYWDAGLFIAWLKDEKRKSGDMEGLAEVVSMIERKDAVLITSVISRTEVLESTLTQENKGEFDKIFQRTNCKMVDLNAPISELAHDIREYYKASSKVLGTPDCQHLATAIAFGCDELHTFDEKDMIPLSGNVAERNLIICKPKGEQMVMNLDHPKIKNPALM